jgi:hypothetical protein
MANGSAGHQVTEAVRMVDAKDERQLLALLTDPPAGAEPLLHHVVVSLTKKAAPSDELVDTITRMVFGDRKLVMQARERGCDDTERPRGQDARFLVPVMARLKPEQVRQGLVKLVATPQSFSEAVRRCVKHASSQAVCSDR